jgi:hypothetical protein
MNRLERIGNRFPRIYRTWEEESLLRVLLRATSNQMDKTESGVDDILKAHWIDTAEGDELDKFSLLLGTKRLREEDDAHLRAHLKRAVYEYKGGGTVSAIMEEFKTKFREDKDLQIIENPPEESYAEFLVIANDTWVLGSNSIKNEEATLSLTVEGEGQVSNPSITNVDTGESITFNGQMKKGEKLVVAKNHAMLDEKDVVQSVTFDNSPLLLRKGSRWKYSEALLELIGVFDGGRFDKNTFAMGVPTVRVRFDWTRQQPATFMVQVKSKALADSGLAPSYLKKTANYLKAA